MVSNSIIIYQEIKAVLIKVLGYHCVMCNNYDFRVLQFDHKKGSGRKEARSFKSGFNMAKYYYKNLDIAKDRLQLLCANCNWIKRSENKEHIYAKIRTTQHDIDVRFKHKIRADLFKIVGAKCILCNNDDIRVLIFRRKNGSFNQELNIFGSATVVNSYYRKNPDRARSNLYTICWNCSYIQEYKKRMEREKMKYHIYKSLTHLVNICREQELKESVSF